MFRSLQSNSTARGFVALYAGTLMSGTWAMIIPTIPVLGREFGVSAGGAAQIVTATAIGKFFGTIAAGIMLDRMGARAALVGGPLAGCIAALLCAVVPWFSIMLFLSLCIGAADSLGATAREFAAIDLARRNQRGRLISSMHGTHNIGAAIAPFVGGWLTEVFSFKAAFVGYAVSCALAALLGAVGPNTAAPVAANETPESVSGWGAAALGRRLRWVIGVVQRNSARFAAHLCRSGAGNPGITVATNRRSEHAAALRRSVSAPLAEPGRYVVHHFRRGRVRHDHSRRVPNGPRRQKVVHGAKHGSAGAGVLC